MLCGQVYGVKNCVGVLCCVVSCVGVLCCVVSCVVFVNLFYSIILCGQQYVVYSCVTVLCCSDCIIALITVLQFYAVLTAVWC